MEFVALSTSRGTTLRSVLERVDGCRGLVTDRSDRGCVQVAKEFDVPVRIVPRNKITSRNENDERVSRAVSSLMKGARSKIRILAALGWMYLLSPEFLQKWPNVLNVHPSLLPDFPGAHAIRDALKAKSQETGMTIHWIDEGTDTGQIVMQHECVVERDDTEETLKARIQALEKEWYPRVMTDIARAKIQLLVCK